jgi:hypothetical protein
MTNVEIITPTGKKYTVGVEGNLCRRLIKVFDEIDDIPCQSWIYGKLDTKIVQSTPHFIGSYLGYTWQKQYTPVDL